MGGCERGSWKEGAAGVGRCLPAAVGKALPLPRPLAPALGGSDLTQQLDRSLRNPSGLSTWHVQTLGSGGLKGPSQSLTPVGILTHVCFGLSVALPASDFLIDSLGSLDNSLQCGEERESDCFGWFPHA